MRVLELRRHTLRLKPGQHLSQPGVTLARRVGETLGPFERVITSNIPRAYETALAMGFAVHEQVAELALLRDGVEDEISGWDVGFAGWSAAAQQGGQTAIFAQRLHTYLADVARTLSETGTALLVTHGGVIEACVIGSLPDADHAKWGRYISYCEGARIRVDGEQFVDAEILRLR